MQHHFESILSMIIFVIIWLCIMQSKWYNVYCLLLFSRYFFFLFKQDLIIQNISAQDIQWIFDLGNTGTLFRTGIFKFSTLTGNLGPYEMCTVSISFCPSKYFLIFILIISMYYYSTLFHHVYKTLDDFYLNNSK